MLLTRIWAAVLSLLATAFLAGMFLLSIGSSGGFTESDRTAIRAVTEAGLAAFEADIQSSPVTLGPSLLKDTRLKEAMDVDPEDPKQREGLDLQGTFVMVANEGLLESYPLMSLALIDKAGAVAAKTGLDEGLFEQIAGLSAFTSAQSSPEEELFSATLAGKLYAVKVSRPEVGASARRLVAIAPVDLGGGSFLRRVLGTSNPAGLVRDGEVLGEPIGGANPTELVALVADHMDSAPPEGASQVLEVGEGANKRLGAIGRVPGPAGRGEHGTIFAVLSLNTEGATQKELAQSLKEAMDEGMGQVSWPAVLGLLFVSLALSFYLPHLESTAPLRRLAGEFQGLAQGNQHQIFYDTYGGQVGVVARAAVQAQEALRLQWEAEFQGELDDEDAMEFPKTGTRRTRSVRATRSSRRVGRNTRGNQAVPAQPEPAAEIEDPGAIELPDAPPDAMPEGLDAALEGNDAAPAPEPEPEPAPLLADTVSGDEAESMLGDELGLGGAKPPPPRKAATPPPPRMKTGGGAAPPPTPPAAAASPADAREAYYREIYNEFVDTKNACGEPTAGFTYEKFAKKLRKNTEQLMKPGVKDVQFTVYVKDGKAALKAKVVKD